MPRKKTPAYFSQPQPACETCFHAVTTTPDGLIQCDKKGNVQPFFHCRRYTYDPTMRVPKVRPALPKYSPEDFKL